MMNSAAGIDQDALIGMFAGATAYLTKPFTQDTLIEAVQVYAAFAKDNQDED